MSFRVVASHILGEREGGERGRVEREGGWREREGGERGREKAD